MKVLKLFKTVSFFANLSNKNGIYVSGVGRIPNWLIDLILLSPMTICTIQMIVFCFVHGTTLVSISGAVYLMLGILSITSMYICFVIKNDLLIDTIDHLQETVDKRMEGSIESKALYENEELWIESFAKKLIYYSSFVIVSVYLPPFLFPIGYAITGFPPPKIWYLPYPTAVPFDVKTPIGFYPIWLLQSMSGMTYMLLVTVISCFYIGLCVYIDTCIVDLSEFVNYPAEGKQIDNLQIKQHLFNMINFHISILSLLENVRSLMNGPLFFQLLVYAVFIALNLLQFDETIKEFDFSILLNMNSFFTQILLNYISCYYANNVTLKSSSVADIAYNMRWYMFPVQDQRLIIKMIQRAQKPFHLKGFGIVDCTLATFLNFIRASVSYYILFRQIGN